MGKWKKRYIQTEKALEEVAILLHQQGQECLQAREEIGVLRQSLAPDSLADSLQATWGDYVAETGCIPDEIQIHGPRTTRLTADFTQGEFAGHLSEQILGGAK